MQDVNKLLQFCCEIVFCGKGLANSPLLRFSLLFLLKSVVKQILLEALVIALLLCYDGCKEIMFKKYVCT